ncbi:MAG: HAMP domain-containing histidine kinase [Synechococcus sp. SB0666_bin_14]|nr:HAMP domain-containing histidine kinase [Synechococcus sp. SB0666_bin_14]MYA90608.1 HAMP domain-containing histidine kinase [Synechococcus sp. SB0663_bin_10]MYG46216.1 HAMP domain-containing histidine kinase [Synechococcus sp. SB0675_bin_6]MYJ59976.1 HAMP domain-containing histidine kinase [Synechococcus sp. SB0672_bin_6]MYK92343.1 HAMP domain-containing histidine kinase [Synechococcus sp. SB0669_bin_8]
MAQPSLRALHQLLWRHWSGETTTEEGARRQWWAALQVIQEDLSAQLGEAPSGREGVWLTAPLPALHEPNLLPALQGWVWMPERFSPWILNLPLLPGQATDEVDPWSPLTLQPDDGRDPFLVLVTRHLQLAISLRPVADQWALLVCFDGATVFQALELLRRRLLREDPGHGQRLRGVLEQLGPVTMTDNLGSERRFWSALACRLASMPPSLTVTASPVDPSSLEGPNQDAPEPSGTTMELEFLEALSHGIRTPLATIRVLSRVLSRRADLGEDVQRQLAQIDAECTVQIDRFGLIFHTAELQRQPKAQRLLSRTNLASLVEQQHSRWQQQLERYGLQLQLELERNLPDVMSDPLLVAPMLAGVVERFGQGLRSGTTLHVVLTRAGGKLRLQLRGDSQHSRDEPGETHLGAVLTWKPETGRLHLSRSAIRQLFSSLGGRMAERGPQQLTLFFPLAQGL